MANERKRLNIRIVDSLKPKAGKYDVIDTEGRGLVLRVRPSGKKTWYVRGRLEGRDTWRRLGDYHREHFAVKAARDKAAEYRAAFEQGEDPDAPPPAGDINTLGDLWTLYRAEVETLGRKPTGIAADRLNWSTFLEGWADRPLTEITRAEVRALTTRIYNGIEVNGLQRGGPTAANRAKALLSSMWRYADEDHHPPNPCRGIEPKHEVGRRTFIAADRLPDFLEGVEAEGGAFADAVVLAMVTGLRRSNLTGLRWEWVGELVPDGGRWTLKPGDLDGDHPGIRIPAEDFKGGRPHLVPLVPEAVELLKRRREAATKGAAWVFPSDRAHSGHLGDCRYRWTRLAGFLSCEDANETERDDPRPGWHTLRHTLARTLYGLTPFADVVAEILGHSRAARQGVTATYTAANPEAVRPYLVAAVRAMLGKADADAEAAPSVVVPFTRDQNLG